MRTFEGFIGSADSYKAHIEGVVEHDRQAGDGDLLAVAVTQPATSDLVSEGVKIVRAARVELKSGAHETSFNGVRFFGFASATV